MNVTFGSREIDLLGFLKILLVLAVAFLFVSAFLEYRGEKYVYLIFTITSSLLLYFGFGRNAIFFDTFIGIFLWLGFWLKLTVRVAFMDSQFHESIGEFDGSSAAFDSALLVTSCAFSGLIVTSYLRGKFLFVYPLKPNVQAQQGLGMFYKKNRTIVLLGFAVLIAVVAITNVYFGFYQRGSITRTALPFGLNGIYKWLLLFGLASVSAVILKFEYFDNNKKSYLVAVISLIETFASNVSLLSRGMILNSGALVFGFYKSISLYQIKFKIRFIAVCVFILIVLFGSSVFGVNYVRSAIYYAQYNEGIVLQRTAQQTRLLFLDRWVGIEGVLAVSSYSDKGWDLWRAALQEKYSENKTSFYDINLIDSPYKNTDMTKHHFISLPGIVAFSFYPGSYPFLFFCMIIIGMFAFFIELFVYKLGGANIILCALIAQVVAYRYSSFGYVPAQSYLLFGSIFLNIILIYLVNKILASWYQRKTISIP